MYGDFSITFVRNHHSNGGLNGHRLLTRKSEREGIENPGYSGVEPNVI